jgi:predicted CoA-binding protein
VAGGPVPDVMPSIAVIGASTARHKFGNKAVRAYLRQGWTVYPVNPNEPTIEGLRSYPSIGALPDGIERASLYLPPDLGITVLDEIRKKGIPELWVNPGAESDELLAEAERLGLNVIQACSIVDVGERPGLL